MSELTTLILTILLSLTPYHTDSNFEDEEQRKERMEVIAKAIADVSLRATCKDIHDKKDCKKIWGGTPKQLAALLIQQGYSESGFSHHVHAGNCRDDECDAFKRKDGTIVHLARSSWQMHHTRYTTKYWDKMEGTDYISTWNAAAAATKLLSRGYASCGSIYGTISQYATGKTCDWKGARKRVTMYKNLRMRLNQPKRNK